MQVWGLRWRLQNGAAASALCSDSWVFPSLCGYGFVWPVIIGFWSSIVVDGKLFNYVVVGEVEEQELEASMPPFF